jgi:hypothetical protein
MLHFFRYLHPAIYGSLDAFPAWNMEHRLMRLRAFVPGFIEPPSTYCARWATCHACRTICRAIRHALLRWRHQRRDVFRAEGEDFDSSIDGAIGKDYSIGAQRVPHHA